MIDALRASLWKLAPPLKDTMKRKTRLGLSATMQALAGALLVLCIAMGRSTANEIDGFRLGMSFSDAAALAAEKGYSVSKPQRLSQRWVNYVLFKDGPSLSFCDATLSAVNSQRSSNFHEIANTLREWSGKLGDPEVLSNPTYAQGVPFSSVDFRWVGDDNIRRSVTVTQYGQQQLNIGFGYSYVLHPCR
jgi:hypothetical protein